MWHFRCAHLQIIIYDSRNALDLPNTPLQIKLTIEKNHIRKLCLQLSVGINMNTGSTNDHYKEEIGNLLSIDLCLRKTHGGNELQSLDNGMF